MLIPPERHCEASQKVFRTDKVCLLPCFVMYYNQTLYSPTRVKYYNLYSQMGTGSTNIVFSVCLMMLSIYKLTVQRLWCANDFFFWRLVVLSVLTNITCTSSSTAFIKKCYLFALTCELPAFVYANACRKTPLEIIHRIGLGSKDIYCIFKTCYEVPAICSTKSHFIS